MEVKSPMYVKKKTSNSTRQSRKGRRRTGRSSAIKTELGQFQARQDSDFFSRLSAKQTHDILWTGCTDRRVAPNTLLNVDPEKMFVHSNIANVALPSDLNAQSVITKAVGVLKVNHIMVVGHYGCGCVTVCLHNLYKKFLNPWIIAIDDV